MRKTTISPLIVSKMIQLRKSGYSHTEIMGKLGLPRNKIQTELAKAFKEGVIGTARIHRKKIKTQLQPEPQKSSNLVRQFEMDEKRRVRQTTVVVSQYQGFVFRSTPDFWLFQN
jgi:DNA-binding transcriptional regulator LsrR (DeoR family)